MKADKICRNAMCQRLPSQKLQEVPAFTDTEQTVNNPIDADLLLFMEFLYWHHKTHFKESKYQTL